MRPHIVIIVNNYDTAMWDVVIVGAGPSGSAPALSALRDKPDSKVLIIDSKPAGRDKTCGDGLGPDVFPELAKLGCGDVLHAE